MSKHTPGPWHVIERANGQAFSIGCQVQTKGNFVTTHYIANITDRATPQAEADARLIAAAPDMRAALREVIGMLPALREVESVKTVLGVLE